MYKKTSGIILIIFIAVMASGCAASGPYGGGLKQMGMSSASSNLAREGKALYEQGDYLAALEILDTAYRSNPRDWDALYYRGLTHLKLENYNESITDLDRGRAWSPQTPRFQVELANAYIEKGSFAKAETTFSWIWWKEKSYQPYLAKAYKYRAKLYLKTGRRNLALSQKKQAIELDPRLIKEFEADDALEIFLDWEKRTEITTQAMLAAKQAEASGNILEAFKQYDRAYFWSPETDVDTLSENILSNLFRLYPQLQVKPSLTELGRRFFIQAQALMKAKKYSKALEAYNKLIGVMPYNPEAWFNGAMLRAEKKEYQKAINNMKVYLRIMPDAADARAAQDKIYEWEAFLVSGGYGKTSAY